MSSIGKISLDLNVNSKGFNKQVNGIQKQTTKAFGGMSVAIGNIVANVVQKAAAGIGKFVKDSINKGSELSELQNVVDSVFTTMSDKVESFSKNALTAYGLTEAQSKRMVGTFGAMSKSFGYSEQQAYDMSTALTGLAGDVASFYNLSHDEAYTKLKSVFTGETESLKELGVVMTQTALDEFAMAKGFGKTTAKMSEQEKVALRLAFVQDKLATATGDFTRTQDQWANQTRILSGQFESLKAALGQGFINILKPVIKMLNTFMGKLVQAAEAFKSFTEMLMGVKSKGSTGAAMKEVADAAESAAGSTGGIEEAADGAAASAKKAQKALMGFDEINKLSSNDAGSSAMSGASFERVDFGTPSEEVEAATIPVLDSAISKIKELIELFKTGFKEGLGPDFESSIIRVREHISSIGTQIKDVFTDPKVVKAADNWMKTVSRSLGRGAGAFISIGQTIGENLIGGVDRYLTQNSGIIKQRLVGILDASAEYWAIAGELSAAVASIFEVFRSEEAKQITADLISIFSNAGLGVAEIALKIGNDAFNMIAQPIIENKDKIKEALENTFRPIGTVVSTIAESVNVTFQKVFEVYEQYIHPAFQGITEGLSSVVSTLLDAYNTHISPVLDSLAEKFKEVWEGHVQPVLDKAIEIIGKLMELISVVWKNVLVPLINWLIETVVPIVAPIIETVGKLAMDLFGTISDIVKGILGALEGLLDFLIGVFTGDWQRAWEGIQALFTGIWEAIKSFFIGIWEALVLAVTTKLEFMKARVKFVFEAIKSFGTTIWNFIKNTISGLAEKIATNVFGSFSSMKESISSVMEDVKTTVTTIWNGIWDTIKGVINSILGGIESMANGIINGINSAIRALNKMKFKIPKWVPKYGGKEFSLGIKTIQESVSLPRLAQGGYVRANQPQPVIVGDNKTQGEIIAPENKILELVLDALNTFFSQLQQSGYRPAASGSEGDIVIPIYLDGTILDEVIVTAQQRRDIRSGGR